MHPIIEAKKEAIVSLCREFKVRRLDVFGSALGREFNPTLSDLDLVVDFLPATDNELLDHYFGLKHGLESLFSRPVDLIELDTLRSERLRKIVDHERVPVYAEAA